MGQYPIAGREHAVKTTRDPVDNVTVHKAWWARRLWRLGHNAAKKAPAALRRPGQGGSICLEDQAAVRRKHDLARCKNRAAASLKLGQSTEQIRPDPSELGQNPTEAALRHF
jgi:hypothetical protein